ncbi:hypothetical protein DXN04_28255 [Chitinophaga silvisoli]|uniref:Uncharacterized protein n=1 Tax=Chitinophaga silvisoli TaxID=2291814 RepID=A0A3E1NUJ3_9BACT|nr:hypothetical protein DXN04_28255 [Chitinophaga silvisoli]
MKPANEINEPLTGPEREYHLYSFLSTEMVTNSSLLQENRLAILLFTSTLKPVPIMTGKVINKIVH